MKALSFHIHYLVTPGALRRRSPGPCCRHRGAALPALCVGRLGLYAGRLDGWKGNLPAIEKLTPRLLQYELGGGRRARLGVPSGNSGPHFLKAGAHPAAPT
jgi:hypothetical protein